jgi:hypothetical protein
VTAGSVVIGGSHVMVRREMIGVRSRDGGEGSDWWNENPQCDRV